MSDDELIEAMKAAFESVADSGMWAWDDAMRAVLARAERAEVDAEIGRKWHADSSLETWFPYTAEELVRLRAERDALRAEVELWKERAYQLSHA